MKILKTLIHPLTAPQQEELVGNEIVELKAIAPELASFLGNTPDNDGALAEKAEELINLCHQFDAVLLPCGSPKFAWMLSQLWLGRRVKAIPLFAHSERVSIEKEVPEFVEKTNAPGIFIKKMVVQKQSLFSHVRFF